MAAPPVTMPGDAATDVEAEVHDQLLDLEEEEANAASGFGKGNTSMLLLGRTSRVLLCVSVLVVLGVAMNNKGPTARAAAAALSGISQLAADSGISCLGESKFGCNALESERACLTAKDKHGDACVWCGGEACSHSGDSKCTTLSAAGSGMPSTWSVASCPLKTKDEITCLEKAWDGCAVIDEEKECLSVYDGRSNLPFIMGRRFYREPCVWCGGKPCRPNSSAKCEPLDWISGEMHDKLPSSWTTATCK